MDGPWYCKACVWARLYTHQGNTERWYEIMAGLPKTMESSNMCHQLPKMHILMILIYFAEMITEKRGQK